MKRSVIAILLTSLASLALADEIQPWPRASGPYGNYLPIQRDGMEFVDDLGQAKLLWESKCDHFGWVKTSSNLPGHIYANHFKGHPGSGATPIVAEGKIFHSSFRPSGPMESGRNVEAFLKTLREKRGAVDPERVMFLRKNVRLEAEDIVFALDAETGDLAWEAVEPGGVNLGAGKRWIWKPSPVYSDGKVFALGTTGMIRAYDAQSGKKLWEKPHPLMRDKILADIAKSKASESQKNVMWYAFDRDLFAIGGRVIVPSFGDPIGLNAETDEVVWQLEGEQGERVQGSFSNPGLWRHQGKTYLVYAGSGADRKGMLSLVDPVDGRILWKHSIGRHTPMVTVVGDIAFVSVDDQMLPYRVGQGAPTDQPHTLMGGVRLSLTGAKVVWTLPKGEVKYAYIPNPDRGPRRHDAAATEGRILYNSQGGGKGNDTETLFLIEAETGKILAEAPLTNSPSPYPYQIGNRVLVFQDGAHNNQRAKLFSLPDLKLLTDAHPWQHAGTTAYQLNIEHPIVNGRIYLRTKDGTLACYDLRK